jgi:hypothetical protein
MVILQALGWLCVAATAGFAVRVHCLDARLQDYRAPEVGRGAYIFVPIRWQRRFYKPEGHPIVAEIWRMTAAMYGAGILGMILLAASGW